ncbi:MAG: AI-2E family transporter [Bryobacterales bacterium]|nr:AI-2E family transporter [Bryobacterales bacterium]
MEDEKPIRVVVRPSVWQLLRQIGGNLAHWVGGQLLIAFLLTICYAVGFALAGLPWWPVFAIINGVFHLIPMVGAALGLLLPFLGWLLLTTGDPWMLLWIIAVYALAQAFESFYLTPKILGYKLRLKPFLVFLGVVLGSSLFGFVGALFAAPVMAVAMTIWRWWYEHREPKEK